MAEQTFTSGQILTAAQMTTLQTNIGLAYVTSGSFTTSALVNVDGCFTSTYRNYRIIIDITATTGVGAQIISTQLRSGGTAASGSNYLYARSGFTYAGVGASDVSGASTTYFFLNRSNGSGSVGGSSTSSVDFHAPQLAQPTYVNGTVADGSYAGSVGGYHNLSTSYDGFNIATTTALTTITGTYRVYGYRD